MSKKQQIKSTLKELDISSISMWKDQGTQAYYVRFHQPVPPAVNKEPVSEFYIKGPTGKYIVDSIWLTPHGVIWEAYGEVNISALANVVYSRLRLKEE